MKLKYLFVSLISLSLVACTEPEVEDEILEVVESITEEVIEEVVEEEVEEDFAYFEDYAGLLTKDELVAQFGQDNLKDGESWFAEGTIKKEHTVLTNPANGNIIKYLWNEDGKTLSSIEATHYKWGDSGVEGKQFIGSKDGLKLGMSLDDLKDWNEADFEFSGFGWDYAGGIFEKEGSKLTNSDVEVTLINDQEASNEGFDFIIGDVVLNTSESRLMGAPILIEQFTYYIEKE